MKRLRKYRKQGKTKERDFTQSCTGFSLGKEVFKETLLLLSYYLAQQRVDVQLLEVR